MRFAIFPYVSKVWRLPRKIDARSYEVLRLSRKIIFPKLKIWCSKMQRLSGHQRPDLPTSLMNMSLVLRLPREMHLCRSSANVPRVPSFLEMLQNPHVLLTFGKVQNPLRLPRKTTSEPSKVVRSWCALYILTWKCASRHNGVQLFISHHFSSDPHGSAPAALASVLFESFRHSGATNHYNNTVFRDFPTFSHICIFCLLTLSLLIFSLLIFLFSLPLPYSAFHLSILSEVWLLNSLCLYSVFHFCEINLGSHSYGHLLLVITGYFYGILHFINGVSLVLTTGILGHNCNSYPFFLGFYMVSYGF